MILSEIINTLNTNPALAAILAKNPNAILFLKNYLKTINKIKKTLGKTVLKEDLTTALILDFSKAEKVVWLDVQYALNQNLAVLLDKKNRIAELKAAQCIRFFSQKQQKNIIISHSSKGNAENLNGKALDLKGEEIKCRHLAHEIYQRDMKNYHEDFASVENLEKQPNLMNNLCDNKEKRLPFNAFIIFDLENIGIVLEKIAETLPPLESINMLFHSENHVMNFKIINKTGKGKKFKYVVKFQDPNVTSTHYRILFATLNGIKHLAISGEGLDYYFESFKVGLFCFQHSEALQKNYSNHLEGVLFYALSEGFNSIAKKIINEILTSKQSQEKKLFLLQAKGLDRTPGFYFSLQGGLAEVAKIYMQAVLRSDLNCKFKIKLLEAKDAKDGSSAFFTALENGFLKIVREYIYLIQGSHLPPQAKMKLLLARNNDDLLGVFMAEEEGHVEVVKEYMEQCPQVLYEIIKSGNESWINQFVACFYFLKANHVVFMRALLISLLEIYILDSGVDSLFLIFKDESKHAARCLLTVLNNRLSVDLTKYSKFFKRGLLGEMIQIFVQLSNLKTVDAFIAGVQKGSPHSFLPSGLPEGREEINSCPFAAL